MAVCKKCNAIIPDGMELCQNCLEEEMVKSNESYLDSLLSSVKNSAPGVDEIYKRKNAKDNADNDDESDEEVFAAADDIWSYQGRTDETLDYTVDMKDFIDLFETIDLDDALQMEKLEEMEEPAPDTSGDKKDNYTENAELNKEDIPYTAEESIMEQSEEMDDSVEEDLLSLLNSISSDDPLADDAKAISNILSGQADDKDEHPTVGEVFTNTLKVVTSLDDQTAETGELLQQLSETDEKADKKKKKEKKEKKEIKIALKKEKKEKKKQEKIEKQKAKEEKKKEKKQEKEKAQADKEQIAAASAEAKKSIWQRLFGNVHDESTAGKKDSDRQQEETIEAAAKGKAKKSLFAKLFKRKDDTAVADEENNSDSDAGKNKKEEKKEKKKKRKEIIKVIDEVEEDEGRINRVGAGIVFVFFGLLAICLLFGTNKITYSLSIQHAADYFERQKYDEAYSEICAVDLKDEDMAIYDKIMTVMYVNKYLNSYKNYYYLECILRHWTHFLRV